MRRCATFAGPPSLAPFANRQPVPLQRVARHARRRGRSQAEPRGRPLLLTAKQVLRAFSSCSSCQSKTVCARCRDLASVTTSPIRVAAQLSATLLIARFSWAKGGRFCGCGGRARNVTARTFVQVVFFYFRRDRYPFLRSMTTWSNTSFSRSLAATRPTRSSRPFSISGEDLSTLISPAMLIVPEAAS